MTTTLTSFLLVLALAGCLTEARQMTVYNHCPFTIWPGIYTGGPSQGKPDGVASNGGWELAAYQNSTFNVPDNWRAGLIWARQACDFRKADVKSCVTGSCIGGLHCENPGIPPATLAEFTLNASGQDYYDSSLVDGSNLPIRITANGCPTAGCPVDLNPGCPDPLRVRNQDGTTVGCLSACARFGAEANCCKVHGSMNKPETCRKSGVQYYDYFKSRCPNSYAYHYDESSGTALWTCRGAPSYTITFCP